MREDVRRKLKYVVLTAVLLAVLAGIGAFAYQLVAGYRRTERFQAALAELERGNFEAAREQLTACILEDQNNETAIAKLAEVMEREKHWYNAALLWRRAAALNAFEGEYSRRMLQALAMCREYAVVRRELSGRNRVLTAEQNFLLVRAELLAGRRDAALRQFLAIPAADRESREAGRLLTLVFNEKKIPAAARLAELDKLAASADAVVAFEALLARAELQSQEKLPGVSDTLLAAYARHPAYMAPVLGDRFFLARDFDKAAVYYREALKNGPNPALAVRLGEVLAAKKQTAEIRALSRDYQNGSKQMLQAGYYLDALAAFLDGNDAELTKCFEPLYGVYRTPVSQMISLRAAILEGKNDELLRTVAQLKSAAEPRTLYFSARDTVRAYVAGLLRDNRMEAAARVARAIDESDKPDLLLTQVITMDAFRLGTLAPGDLNEALRRFPDDPVLLGLAAALALQRGRFDDAAGFAGRNLAAGNDTAAVRLQLFAAFEGSGKVDQAMAELAKIRAGAPKDASLAYLAMTFFVRYGRLAELEQLSAEVHTGAAPEMAAFLPLLDAEIARLKNDPARMLALLEDPAAVARLDGAKPNDAGALYRMAFLLAGADRFDAAIALYEKILKHYPDRALVLVNLSELHAAAGRPEQALEAARKAFEENSSAPFAQECYGLRLVESKDYTAGRRLLKPLLMGRNRSARALEGWQLAMEQLIRQAFDGKNFIECIALCRELAAVVPEHAAAKEFSGRAAAAKRAADDAKKAK